MSATRILFGLWSATAAAFVILWFWGALNLPDRVPVHLDITGAPTRWGSRWELLGVLGIAGPLTIALPALIATWIRRGGKLTHVNIPHKEWWLAEPEREREVRRRVAFDLLAISFLTGVLFVGALAGTIVQARSPQPETVMWPTWLLWISVAAIILYAVLASTVRYRIDPAERRN
ncbi:MAG TPA: DUF1648 domain-containing protein [Propionibacterium sp.]|nr:DUF1648 domain-containing protein [Propionibacterium sp.]